METKIVLNDANVVTDGRMKKSKKFTAKNLENRKRKLKALGKIAQSELAGGEAFFNEVENDEPVTAISPNEADYLHEKFSTKIKAFFANAIAKKKAKKIETKRETEVVGEENLLGLRGAVIVMNHFAEDDGVAISAAMRKAGVKNKLYKTVSEREYRESGIKGFCLRYANTLPVAKNAKTAANFTKAVERYLCKGNFVLAYPERTVWWNYRKPRSFENAPFRYAVKACVPVVPCFVTLKNLPEFDENGFPMQKYTVHVMSPIYPSAYNTESENVEMLNKSAYAAVTKKYESVYGEKLTYCTNNTAKN